jgi:predicted DNA-binding transcriptional regulator YafY
MAENPQALIHLDMPRWFGGQEQVPHLRTLAKAVRLRRRLAFGYRNEGDHAREADPLGLVNKAGLWYLVARTTGEAIMVFRAARIASARLLPQSAERPPDFELAAFWAQWSAEFTASRPRLSVTVRASPDALAAFPEIFGDAVRDALAKASEPDQYGWRVVTLSFEHEQAAAHRLAGFGDRTEVLEPPQVRARLVATAHAIIDRYR